MEEIENAKKSNREPSFGRACRIFCQTRVIISSVFFIGAVILQFIAPVSNITVLQFDFLKCMLGIICIINLSLYLQKAFFFPIVHCIENDFGFY